MNAALQVFFEIYDWPPFVIALIASVAAVAAGAALEMSVRACLKRPISPSSLALAEQEHHRQQEAEATKLTSSESLLLCSRIYLCRFNPVHGLPRLDLVCLTAPRLPVELQFFSAFAGARSLTHALVNKGRHCLEGCLALMTVCIACLCNVQYCDQNRSTSYMGPCPQDILRRSIEVQMTSSKIFWLWLIAILVIVVCTCSNTA